MKLTGAQIRRIQQAFLDAFHDYGDLSRMVRVALDRNLNEFVEYQPLEGAVFELIEWSDRQDNVEQMIEGAYQYRPGNRELQALVQESEQWDTLHPPASAAGRAAEPSTSEFPTPETSTPETSPDAPSQVSIEEAPTVQLTPLERQLMRMALATYERDVLASDSIDARPKVIVEHKFDAGFSGAVVLLIDPGPGRAPVVAKIGPFGDLQQEYEGYDRLIRRTAPNIAAPVFSQPWPAGDGSGMGIILYIYGSAPRQLPHSLLDYYDQVGGEKAATVLQNLLVEHGRELWGNTHKERFWMVQEYDRLLPVHLEVIRVEQGNPIFIFQAGQVDDSELRTLPQNALVRLAGFTLIKFVNVAAQADRPSSTRLLLQAPPPRGKVSGALRILLIQSQPPPVGPGEVIDQVDVQVTATRLQRLIEMAQEVMPGFNPQATHFALQSERLPNPLLGLHELLDSRTEANWSTIHGDLNLQNILVDPPSGYARLIDFAETRRGPTLFDLHRLVVQVITKLLTKAVANQPALGPESLSYLLHELHNDNPATESPVPALQNVYVVLRELRQISTHYVDQYDGWRFFYNGLWIALIGALRFAELDQAARYIVLVGAAKAKELAQTPVPPANDKPPAPGVTPYKGLVPFAQSDAELFHGRGALTARIMAYLAHKRFLTLVGASGSGKSSLANAGLISAFLHCPPLANGTQPICRVLVLTPTEHPLQNLAQTLIGPAGKGIASMDLYNAMRTRPDALLRFIQEQLPFAAPADNTAIDNLSTDESSTNVGGERRLLLLVDQMEELFTLCRDEAERILFINNLLTAAGEAESPPADGSGPHAHEARVHTLVVCTLRADFYAHFLNFAQMRDALEKSQIIVGPMTVDELREAITGPAQTPYSAWYFEPGLVDQMIDDLGAEPGALPLLSHVLLETWRRRSGRTLTLAGYQSAGRVQDAIAQTAESLYANLGAEEQALTKRIFLALTELGEGSQDTRRRVSRRDLVPSAAASQISPLLEQLAQRRLITLSQEHIEVAHEALIRRWPRLQQWLDADREGLRIERRLREAARQWENGERDAYLLYRGAQLVQALEWVRQQNGDVPVLAREFLAFSETVLAQAEWARGDAAYAQTHLEEAVELAPHLPYSHLALFNYLVETAQFNSALDAYRRLLAQAGAHHRLLPAEFQVDRVVGQSRLGLVFKAWQQGQTAPVAITLTPPTLPVDAHLLVELRQSYLGMNSPYISRYLAIEPYGDRYYLVTAFVEGESLEAYLTRQNGVDAQTAFAMLDQVTRGLEDGHAQGLPHLSLNPSNILQMDAGLMLIRYGEERLASTLLPDAAGASIPVPELYVAPEQFTGTSVGFASDIYAVGALARRLFAEQAPREQPSTATLNRALVTLSPALEEALSILILRACAPEAEDRYPAMGALRAELQRIANTQWLRDKRQLVTWGLGGLTRGVAWVRSAGVRIAFILLVIFAAFAELWPGVSTFLPVTRAILIIAFTVYPASLLFAWQARDIAKNSGYASLVLNGSGMGAILGLTSAIWIIQNSAINYERIGFRLGILPPNYFSIFIVMATVMTVIFVLFTSYAVRLSGQLVQRARFSYLAGVYLIFFLMCLLILAHGLLTSAFGFDAMLNFPPQEPPPCIQDVQCSETGNFALPVSL